MDEVTAGLLRIPTSIILIILFLIGLIGLLKKAKNKKTFIALLIIPLVLVYTMYFSGYIRRAPLTESNIHKIIEIYHATGDTDPYRLQSADRKIWYGLHLKDGTFEEKVKGKYNSIEKIFSKKGNINGRDYFISPIFSDREIYGIAWQSACHSGYDGCLYIQLDDSKYLQVDYSISRNTDVRLGFFYAPPVFGEFSFS